MPPKNGAKSKPRRLNPQQLAFAEAYVLTGDATTAYQMAYPKVTSASSAATCASRLLKDAKVEQEIQRVRDKQITATGVTTEWVINQLTTVYTRAMAVDDFQSACTALNMLAKKLGLYEAHQHQKKKYTADDIPRLKALLEAAGWNYSRKNYELPSAN